MISVLFWPVYIFLSRHALFAAHSLPVTWLDRWAGFQPHGWAWMYESNFLLTASIPWMMTSRHELRRYVVGFALLSGASFLIFALFPVASPRPASLDGDALLILITRLDGPLNAFPSLHAASLIYTLALARRLLSAPSHRPPANAPQVLLAVLLVWTVLILWATMATKQHYALDLLAGGFLGWAADWFAWRGSTDGASARASTRRKVGVASQPG
jgi:membrane-associated phospholipid phosphatase